MLSFLQFLRETTAARSDLSTSAGSFWFNSNTGETHNIDHSGDGVEPSTYHAGFVVRNPHLFGLTREELVDRLHQFEAPFPGGSGERMFRELENGATDTHPVIDNAVMDQGWVRVVRSSGSSPTVYGQGNTRGLHRLARHVRDTLPQIHSLTLDVHNAAREFGHLDPSIYAVSHALEGPDHIQAFIESGGAPNPKRYSRILRRKPR